MGLAVWAKAVTCAGWISLEPEEGEVLQMFKKMTEEKNEMDETTYPMVILGWVGRLPLIFVKELNPKSLQISCQRLINHTAHRIAITRLCLRTTGVGILFFGFLRLTEGLSQLNSESDFARCLME